MESKEILSKVMESHGKAICFVIAMPCVMRVAPTDCLATRTIWLIAVTLSSRVVLFAALNFISIFSLGLLDSSSNLKSAL